MTSSNGNFSALLAICAENSPVPGEFPTQRPVTRSFDVFFGLHPNKRLSKQWWGWWFETLSRQLWRHCIVSPCYISTLRTVFFHDIIYHSLHKHNYLGGYNILWNIHCTRCPYKVGLRHKKVDNRLTLWMQYDSRIIQNLLNFYWSAWSYVFVQKNKFQCQKSRI